MIQWPMFRIQQYNLVELAYSLLATSDVVVNQKVPRLCFTGAIVGMQRLQARYASECKVPNKREK